MAVLSEDEKRALRQKQKLLYSSGQFPLRGNATKRPRKRMTPLQAAAVGLVVVLGVVVALVAILTTAA